MDDAELVRQAVAGRTSAYGQLARRHAPRVLALCHARTGRSDVAEDLAQEALLRGWRAIRSLQVPEKFAGWMSGIATRVCLDWIKSARRAEVPMSALSGDSDAASLDVPDASSGRDANDAVEHQDDLAALVAEVERLPAEYREVVMQFYYGDSTYEQIADVLGISAATVNVRLSKARQLLRQRMRQREHPGNRTSMRIATEG